MLHKILSVLFLVLFIQVDLSAQSKHWQKNKRQLHYTEDNGDFLLVNGRYRFNRALYGNNKASRVEAGDLPEFALYMPGMAGNLQFVLRQGNQYKKMIDAAHIETRYRPGSMVYRVKDALLGDGYIDLTVLAQQQEEGLVVKIETKELPQGAKLYAVYGGASGQTFSRGGDIGADPESGFYLLPQYCQQNEYKVSGNHFQLTYLNRKKERQYLGGSFSEGVKVAIADAASLDDLKSLDQSQPKHAPIIHAVYDARQTPIYLQISGNAKKLYGDRELAKLFEEAEGTRIQLAQRIKLRTPERFVNNFGAALAVAADGIWESPTFLHGAVAWRMRLNAWRGAYTADALGWHDRAKEHFSSYANSQVLAPEAGKVVMDTALNLARHIEEMGTSMFSSGYISRNPNNNRVPHHYDMNLVFFDQLFSHFDYTGDVGYLKKMWPTIERHMAWEKRNFDTDDDGLYDAYCAIWASDGLQYSGGGVTHTTAYNYRANRAVAKLAELIGVDATPYQKEADKIRDALKSRLWLSNNGHFAEFQDLLGNKLVHNKPGLWTIYHIADTDLLDEFETYQNLQYVPDHIPHIPIEVTGQEHEGLYTLATSTWQPYTWSVNNVALAENLQTSLAFWQGGRNTDAYQLWKSNIIESMYHGISPGNFQQLSHYDAFRSELYRDFADPIGVASRTLVEGLFGVRPKLLENRIDIRPGFPEDWDFAEIDLPAWSYKYRKKDSRLSLDFQTEYGTPVTLYLEIPLYQTAVRAATVNGVSVPWKLKENAIGQPILILETERGNQFNIEIQTSEDTIVKLCTPQTWAFTDRWEMELPPDVTLKRVHDPQGILSDRSGNKFAFQSDEKKGTFFVQLAQGDVRWWQPLHLDLVRPVKHEFEQNRRGHVLFLTNVSATEKEVKVKRNVLEITRTIAPGQRIEIPLPSSYLSKGTSRFSLAVNGVEEEEIHYTNWDVKKGYLYDNIALGDFYNARASEIFEQSYLTPRPQGPTLQLPTQGIGNWCYPLTTVALHDQGLMDRRKEGLLNYLDVPFLIEGEQQNTAFVSQWDNYPTAMTVPLAGKAQKLYLLMTGSTNPMQSQLTNAKVIVHYADGTDDVLELINPINWWPIEQDFLDDNHAFEIPDDRIPYRVALKTGELYRGGDYPRYSEIKGYTSRAVEGGAATLLDMPLDPSKEINSLEVVAEANDVVVGLMAATLLR